MINLLPLIFCFRVIKIFILLKKDLLNHFTQKVHMFCELVNKLETIFQISSSMRQTVFLDQGQRVEWASKSRLHS